MRWSSKNLPPIFDDHPMFGDVGAVVRAPQRVSGPKSRILSGWEEKPELLATSIAERQHQSLKPKVLNQAAVS